jgi:hypothetical protein
LGFTLGASILTAAARRYFCNENAIGRRFGYGKPNVEIVGIVADARVNSEHEAARPMAFYPLPQGTVYGGCVEARITGDAAALIREIREAVMKADPTLPIDSIRTVRDQVNGNLRRGRLIVWLASVFGAVAPGLACLGIYGTMSYAVARRTGEIGIRMALPGRVFRLVLRRVARAPGLGLVAGTPLVLAASHSVSRTIPGVDASDPAILAGAALRELTRW